jgi:hypothetical protein
VFHINYLEGLLRSKGVEITTFVPKTYEELVGDEDRAIEMQAALRVKDATADKLVQ